MVIPAVDVIRNRLLDLHRCADDVDEQRSRAECLAGTFTRVHTDNETYSAEELKLQEESKHHRQ